MERLRKDLLTVYINFLYPYDLPPGSVLPTLLWSAFLFYVPCTAQFATCPYVFPRSFSWMTCSIVLIYHILHVMRNMFLYFRYIQWIGFTYFIQNAQKKRTAANDTAILFSMYLILNRSAPLSLQMPKIIHFFLLYLSARYSSMIRANAGMASCMVFSDTQYEIRT